MFLLLVLQVPLLRCIPLLLVLLRCLLLHLPCERLQEAPMQPPYVV